MKDWQALSLKKIYDSSPLRCYLCELLQHSILTELSEHMHPETALNELLKYAKTLFSSSNIEDKCHWIIYFHHLTNNWLKEEVTWSNKEFTMLIYDHFNLSLPHAMFLSHE